MEGAGQGWFWVYYGKRKQELLSGGAKATSSREKVLKHTITSHSEATIGLSGTKWSGKRHTQGLVTHSVQMSGIVLTHNTAKKK